MFAKRTVLLWCYSEAEGKQTSSSCPQKALEVMLCHFDALALQMADKHSKHEIVNQAHKHLFNAPVLKRAI